MSLGVGELLFPASPVTNTCQECPMKPTDDQMNKAAAIGRVMAHPLRIDVLCSVGERQRASASGIAASLEMPVSNVSYHVNVLAEAGWLRLEEEIQRRGAVEHVYSLSLAGQGVLDLVTGIAESPSRRSSPGKGSR